MLEELGRPLPVRRAQPPPAPASAAPAPRPSSTPEPSEKPRPTAPAGPIDQLSVEEQCTEIVRRNLSNAQAGVEAFEALVARFPSAPCAYKQLGTFYKKLNKDRNAVDAWRRYLELRPDAQDKDAYRSKIDAIVSRMGQ